jgi:Ca-activated chloride channel family protein
MNYLRYLILLSFLFLSVTVSAQVPRATIVFDASGSMWGRIDGKTKISIAKEALRDVIENWNTDIPLGLTIYGHRKKTDCNDIETVIPMGYLEKEKILSIIRDIKPKGKTPIIRSLRKVANELQYTTHKVTIILISDGKETCDNNPLKSIQELKEKGFDLVIHIVGFDVDKETSDQLQSIAKIAGGTYIPAKDTASLNKAITIIAKKVQKVKPIILPEKNLQISASETKEGKGVQALHTLYLQDANISSSMIERCISYIDTPCNIKVPAGRYILHSTYNLYKKETTMQVYENNISKIHIIMGKTGKVSLTAREKKGASKVALYYTVFTESDHKMISSSNTQLDKAVIEKLPIGNYALHYEYHTYQNILPFKIKTAKTTNLDIIAGKTGKISISASEIEGGEWVSASYSFYRLSKNKKEKNNATALCYSEKERPCQVQLPTGKYLVTIRYKNFTVNTTVKIPYQKKKITKHIILKPTGEVEIIAKEYKEGKAISTAYIIFKDSNGTSNKKATTAYGQTNIHKTVTMELFTGKYYLEAEYCTYKKRFSFDVKAASITQLELIMGETGYANISTILEKNGDQVDAAYTLYYDHNDSIKLLGTACQKKKDLTCTYHLPIGDYHIRAMYAPFEHMKKLHISTGETNQIVFIMNPSGKVQISVDEENGKKRVKAYHTIYPIINHEVNESNISHTCTSEGKYFCELKLPVGDYILSSTYNRFKKKTSFEIKEDETLPLHIIMGQTGEVNITAYEKENSDPIQLVTHYILQKDGNQTKDIKSCWHDLHCLARLPVGHYIVRTEYNILKKNTAFEIKAREKIQLSVIMGAVGKVEIYATTVLGGKKVNADHTIYSISEHEKPKQIFVMCWYDKKLQGCSVSLPEGQYLLRSNYENIKKETKFEITGGKVNEVNVIITTEGEKK